MKDEKILFQIKSLEKKIVQYFLQDQTLVFPYQKMPKPTPTQMQIIDYLVKHADKDVYQRDLEQVFSLKRATISGVLQTMEKNGLISREMANKDARMKKILLNEQTKEIFLQGNAKLTEVENILLKNISSQDVKTLEKVLKQMKQNIEKALK